MAFGELFAPTTDNALQGRRGGQAPYRSQDPVKTLSFQLPQATGTAVAGSISPLVGQTRAGSSIGQAVLQSVLRTVLGADAASAFLSGSPAAAPRMTMPGAPTSAAPRVSGGVTGGMTRQPDEPTSPFSAAPAPPPTLHPGDNPEAPPLTKLPDPPSSTPTPPLPRDFPPYDGDPVIAQVPDFGRGPGTFAGGMDDEGRLNGRSPLFYDRAARF